MGRIRVEFIPARHADHVGGVRALAGGAYFQCTLCGGRGSRRAGSSGRYDLGERWVVGTGRRLLQVRLPCDRTGVDRGGEPRTTDAEFCHACRVVRLTLVHGCDSVGYYQLWVQGSLTLTRPNPP